MNKLRELCENWLEEAKYAKGQDDFIAFETCARELRAILPDVERMVEAAGTLAWATSVEIQGGRRTRAFMQQHRMKCTYWVEQVTAALAFFDQPVAPKETK